MAKNRSWDHGERRKSGVREASAMIVSRFGLPRCAAVLAAAAIASLGLHPGPVFGDTGFSGTVSGDSGAVRGIARVDMTFVGITDQHTPVLERTTTDDAGRYRISLPVGRYLVRAEHPEYAEYTSQELWVVAPLKPTIKNIALLRLAVTVVFVARHAEKADSGSADPPLSPEGQLRAQQLAHALAKARIKAVYTTPTTRTHETAQPTAAAFGLVVNDYVDIPSLTQDIRANHGGQRVLVVGHADTITAIVQALGASPNECVVSGDEYDNLCMVVMTSAKGGTHGANLQYGWASVKIH